jgi:hypothetical protein
MSEGSVFTALFSNLVQVINDLTMHKDLFSLHSLTTLSSDIKLLLLKPLILESHMANIMKG